MDLPFSEQEFLDLFIGYNRTLWPAVLGSWGLAVATVSAIIRGTKRPLLILLFVAALWGWSGVMYHAVFFTEINPAAWMFAALFVLEAACLAWLVMKQASVTFELGSTPRGQIAGALLIYAVLYPVLVWLSGHEFPRAPAFAVPCPTVLFTAGVLLAVQPRVPRWFYIVPILWSILAGSAAVLFHVTPDLMLFAAAAALIIDAFTTAPTRPANVAPAA